MRQSDDCSNVAHALIAVQRAVKPIKRDQLNAETETTYTSVVALWKAIRKAFGDYGLSYSQEARIQHIGGLYAATATTRLMHLSGQWIEGEVSLPFTPASTQQGAAAVTFAKRMGLASICGVVSELEDRDAQGQPEPEPVIEQRHTMLLKAERPKGIGEYFKQVFIADEQRFYATSPALAAELASRLNQPITLTLKGYADGSVEIVGITERPLVGTGDGQ